MLAVGEESRGLLHIKGVKGGGGRDEGEMKSKRRTRSQDDRQSVN